jgi:precorrin-2 dehydrogenase/sirohydrochlorin ferrochelatase
MYPLFLNMQDRLAVVVGSGDVGRRKARALFDAGARVRLVCLEPCTADGATGRLQWLNEPYRDDHLEGAALAIAAASPDINQAVVADAKRRGIWVNSAGDPDAGDFVLPATIRRGDFLLAIGTGGAAPSLAQRVREQLELAFDKAFGEWVALLAELRPTVREKIVDPDRRAAIYHALSDWAWLEQIRTNGVHRVRTDMLTALERWAAEYNGGKSA